MQTAVAFFIFNRPDQAARVFAQIARAQPPRLLVVADGPRLDHPGEAERCTAARAIIEQVDWECEVLTHYSAVNLGCDPRMSTGLDWVFATVDEAIVLEDDCVPHPTFFRFCEEMLARYRDDERIACINGTNLQQGHRRTPDSYYFSRYAEAWGWASWRRAWQHYDPGMALWPHMRDGGWLRDYLGTNLTAYAWQLVFENLWRGRTATWDHKRQFALWTQGALSITPQVNLISNVGFGSTATQTARRSWYSEMAVEPMDFPLAHPPLIIRDTTADRRRQRANGMLLLSQLSRSAFPPGAVSFLRSAIHRVLPS